MDSLECGSRRPKNDNWPTSTFSLVQDELERRSQTKFGRLKKACFGEIKTLEEFDFPLTRTSSGAASMTWPPAAFWKTKKISACAGRWVWARVTALGHEAYAAVNSPAIAAMIS